MKTLITNIGFEAYSCANTAWLLARLENFRPDKIILLYNKDKTILENKKTNISKINEYFKDITIEEVEFEDDFNNYKEVVEHIIESNKTEEIAIDVTAGRKYMSIAAVILAYKYEVKRVYYTHIKYTKKYQKSPITQIPIVDVKLINFMELDK